MSSHVSCSPVPTLYLTYERLSLCASVNLARQVIKRILIPAGCLARNSVLLSPTPIYLQRTNQYLRPSEVGLQIQWVIVNILHRQSRTADKWWSSSTGRGSNNP